jgi:hypothetical protein
MRMMPLTVLGNAFPQIAYYDAISQAKAQSGRTVHCIILAVGR